MKWNKKGMIGSLAPMALAFGVVVIVLAIVATVVTTLSNTQTAGTYAKNVTNDGLSGIANMSGQLPLLATVVIFGIVLAVVVGFLGGQRK